MKVLILLQLLITLALGAGIMKFKYEETNLRFSVRLFETYSKALTGNFVICPVSLHLSMFWLLLGADGHTQNEIREIMGVEYGVNFQLLYEYFISILEKQKSVSMFNRIFVDTDKFDVVDYYKTFLNKTQMDLYNFKNYTEVPSEIYEWFGHMKKPFKQIPGLTILNTIFFIGEWTNTFVRVPGIFHTNRISKSVVMLITTGRFIHYRYRFYTFLELPFVNSDVTLVLVEPDNFYKFELPSTDSLQDIFSADHYRDEWHNVYLRFPLHFINNQPIVLNDCIKTLGLSTSFTDTASFKNLTKSSVKLDSIVQNNYINMDRPGVSFSSASVSMIEKAKRSAADVRFEAIGPFLYFFKHKELGILFAGRYMGP